MNTRHEIAIVGAGVTGLAIAAELLRRGQSCVLIGPQDFTGAASPAAGAMVDAFGEISEMKYTPERWQLEARLWAQRRYTTWLAELAGRSDQAIFNSTGMFIIGNSGGDHDIEKLALMRAEMTRYEQRYEDVSPSDIPGLHPNTQFRAFDAIYMPTALSVDTENLLAALTRLLQQDRRCTWLPATVTCIVQHQKRWRATTTSGEVIEAEQLIVAAGAFSKALLGEEVWQAARLPALYYGRGASCTVLPHESVPHAIRTPNRALSCGIHIVPRAGGGLYLGATNLFGMECDRASSGATVGELHTLLGVISTQLNTRLRNVSIQQVRWGLRPVTAFDHPIAGRTVLDGLTVATGAHRTGIHLAPYFSQLVAAEVLGETLPTEINPFRPAALQQLEPRQKDFALGIRSLLATALYPDGSMPYNRAREIEVFVAELFNLAVTETPDINLKARIRELIEAIAIDEQRMIRVFHEVLQQRIPADGPYVM